MDYCPIVEDRAVHPREEAELSRPIRIATLVIALAAFAALWLVVSAPHITQY